MEISLELDEKDLKKFNELESTIARIRPYMDLAVQSVDDEEGYNACRRARIDVKGVLVELEKSRKRLKSAPLEFGRAIDSEASRLKSDIEPIRDYLVEQEGIVLKERERIRKEKEDKLNAIAAGRVKALSDLEVTLAHLTARNMTQGQFDDLLDSSVKEFEEKQAVRKAEAERVAKEKAEADAATARAEAEVETARKEIEAGIAKINAEKKEIQEARVAAEKKEKERAENHKKEEARIQGERDRLERENREIDRRRKMDRGIEEAKEGVRAEREVEEKKLAEGRDVASASKGFRRGEIEACKLDAESIMGYIADITKTPLPEMETRRGDEALKGVCDSIREAWNKSVEFKNSVFQNEGDQG